MKNIEINYMNEGGYEVLYPKTTTENLIDFSEVLYTKEEVNGFIAGLSNQVGNLHFAYGTYIGQFNEKTVSLGGGAKATEWQVITLGFSPVGVIFSQVTTAIENIVMPRTVYARLPVSNDDSTVPVGFYLPWMVGNYNAVEATSTGFQVREVIKTGSQHLSLNLVDFKTKR